jgi:histone H3/H4
MIKDTQKEWKSLGEWYRDRVRPLLETYDGQRVPGLDSASNRIEKTVNALGSELKFCILGKSGVGKSTLLNALLDPKIAILPQGGVGPLTAQAIVVHYSNEAYFEVSYHGRGRLNRVLFALQMYAESVFDVRNKNAKREIEEELEESDIAEISYEFGGDDPSKEINPAIPSKIDSYLQQGRLIIQGDQFAPAGDVRYIIDGLRQCLGLKSVFASVFTPEDVERIEIARRVLPPKTRKKSAKPPTSKRLTQESPEFRQELRRHAAGSLAPLVADLCVGWPAEVLSTGTRLVDLPGVGIANDEYRPITVGHIRDARAIGIVVDAKGIDEASAKLLQETGFLNSLLLDRGDEIAEDVHLFVAVVKLDLAATDKVREARNEGKDANWVECFEDVRKRAIEMVKGQLSRELLKIADESGDSTREDKRAVVMRLLDSLQVHPVAATEYRDLNNSDPSRIRSPEQSYIPQLGSAIQLAAQTRRDRLTSALQSDLNAFSQSLRSSLALLADRARNDDRAEEEVRILRQEFASFAEPLSKELAARKGAFRTFLRETVPARIDSSVREATDEVRKEILRHLQRYRSYPWQTLRATIRRDGVFDGARNVNLPAELTLKFEEPIAILWSKMILTLVRQRTRELGNDNIRIAGAVVEWVRSQGGKVPPRVAEILEEDLRTDTNELASIGKEAIEELKERVKHALSTHIEERVRRSCQTFVEGARDRGIGVRERMHAFFEAEITEAIVEAARPAAMDVLTGSYAEVQTQVLAALRSLIDPVERAREVVIEREANAILKKDQKERERLMAALAQVGSPEAA